MSRRKRVLRSPFFSALLGGAVVAVVGLIAISAGWVQSSDSGSGQAAAVAPLTAPVADHGEESSTAVNEIYKRDGQGVAFVEADQEAQQTEPSPFNPFGEAEGGGTA